jgi:transcriptional regulator with XRE-family HTH domain
MTKRKRTKAKRTKRTKASITGRRIKALRVELGYTQTDLASRVRVDTSTVCDWETGRSCPRLGRLALVAQSLRCSVSYLIGEKP